MLKYILALGLLTLTSGAHAFELKMPAKALFAEQLPARPSISLPPVIKFSDVHGDVTINDGSLSKSGCSIFNSFTLNTARISTGEGDRVRADRLLALVNIASAYEVLMLNQGQLTSDQVRLSSEIATFLLRMPPVQADVMISQCSRAGKMNIGDLRGDLDYFIQALDFLSFYSRWEN